MAETRVQEPGADLKNTLLTGLSMFLSTVGMAVLMMVGLFVISLLVRILVGC